MRVWLGLMAALALCACSGKTDRTFTSEDKDGLGIVVLKGSADDGPSAQIDCVLASQEWQLSATRFFKGAVSVSDNEIKTDEGSYNFGMTIVVGGETFSTKDTWSSLARDGDKTKVSVLGSIYGQDFSKKLAKASRIEIRGLGETLAGQINDVLRPNVVRMAQSCPGMPPVKVADFAGAWTGHYLYNGARTDFVLALSADPKNKDAFTGESMEIIRGVTYRASINGAVDEDGKVTFKKAYDDPNDSQDIHYEGRLDRGGKHVSGEWTMKSDTGDFELERR
jgi:hypothetical protein